jgi:uncharacterized protein (TIRG00374 family)
MNSFKKILFLLARACISVALLVFLFKQVDIKSLLGVIKNADKALLLAAFLVSFLNYILGFLRWSMLLLAYKIRVPFRRLVVSYSGGIFFNALLPSTIGGDLVRTIDLAHFSKKPRESVATVLLDRLSGYTGLVIVALLAVLLSGEIIYAKSILVFIAAITGILIFILLVLFNPFIYSKINRLLGSLFLGRISRALKNLHQEIHTFKDRKKSILGNLGFSLLIQAVNPLVFYLLSLALGIKVNLLYFFIFVPIVGAVTLLPVSIGGLGLREAAVIFFFAQAGVSKDMALAASLSSSVFLLIYAGLGGLIYVFALRYRRL